MITSHKDICTRCGSILLAPADRLELTPGDDGEPRRALLCRECTEGLISWLHAPRIDRPRGRRAVKASKN
jgi:hypothetical protein